MNEQSGGVDGIIDPPMGKTNGLDTRQFQCILQSKLIFVIFSQQCADLFLNIVIVNEPGQIDFFTQAFVDQMDTIVLAP